MLQQSLRSGLQGFSSMTAVLKVLSIVRIEFARSYTSTSFIPPLALVPLSFLSMQGRREKPSCYSALQRSKARISVEVHPDKEISLLDLRDLCINGLSTETQVMVRREDEQAFAELNGAKVKFVEDAARLLFKELNDEPRIIDFRVVCSHFESLHSHDAVAVLCRGVDGGFRAEVRRFFELKR